MLTGIVKQLKLLEEGTLVYKTTDNDVLTVYGHLLCGVFDKPARADVLNFVNSTGFYSCMKCLQRGVSLQLASGFTFHKQNII